MASPDHHPAGQHPGSVAPPQARAKRHPVSLGPVSPSGALINPAGVPVHVKLWDVSERGLCVVARGSITDPPGSMMTLELHAGVGVETVRLVVQLVWAAQDEANLGTFVGLQCPAGQTLPSGSFLDRFLTHRG